MNFVKTVLRINVSLLPDVVVSLLTVTVKHVKLVSTLFVNDILLYLVVRLGMIAKIWVNPLVLIVLTIVIFRKVKQLVLVSHIAVRPKTGLP